MSDLALDLAQALALAAILGLLIVAGLWLWLSTLARRGRAQLAPGKHSQMPVIVVLCLGSALSAGAYFVAREFLKQEYLGVASGVVPWAVPALGLLTLGGALRSQSTHGIGNRRAQKHQEGAHVLRDTVIRDPGHVGGRHHFYG
jgi:drug/metabolite transporter (DMT)-like permease